MKFYAYVKDIPKITDTQYIVSIDNEYQEHFLDENNKPITTTHFNKKFCVFLKLKDYKAYCETDKNAYEFITAKRRKIYFDIDKINMSYDECIKYLEGLFKIISNLLNIPFNVADYCVLINEAETKVSAPSFLKGGDRGNSPYIKSIHIINTKYSLDYNDNRKLCDYINFMSKEEDISLDLKVYKSKQHFRNVNQSKLSKGIKFEYLFEGFTFNDTIIGYTKNTKMLSFDKYYTEPYKEIIEIDEVELLNIITSNTEDFNYEKFFNQSFYWKTATQIIVKYKLFDIDKWNEISVEKATKPYTIEDNKQYIHDLNVEDLNLSTTTLFYMVSSLSSVSYKPNNLLPLYLTEYIDLTFNNGDKIKEKIFNENKTIQDITDKQNNKLLLDCYNGFMFKMGSCPHTTEEGFKGNFPLCIGNIFYDNIVLEKELIFNTLNTIDEAEIKLNEFLNNDNHKIYVLKSRWGTGKTHKIINNAINYYDDLRILLITESNALNNKLKQDYNFVSHLDKQKDQDINLSTCKKIVCSIQSINKIEKNYFDLVIIDEFESVLNSYLSYTTFKNVITKEDNYNEVAYKILLTKIKTAQKTLCLDADIDENKIKLFTNHFGNDKMVVYKNIENPFNEYDFLIYNKYDFFLKNMFDDYRKGYKIVIAWITSKDKFEEVLCKMIEERNTNILYINVEGVFLYKNGVKSTFDKDYVIPNIEKFINDNNIQVWVYTPTIKTGISFNGEYFDKCYGVSNNNTLICKEFLQSLFRVRKLKTKQINIFIEYFKLFSTNKHIKKNISLNEVKRLFKTNKNLHNELSKSRADNMYFCKSCEGEYFDLQSINTQNVINSLKAYTYNFIYLLKYHNLQYKYVVSYTNYDEYNLNGDKEKKAFEWFKIPLLPFNVFTELKNKNQDRFNHVCIEDKQYITKQFNKTRDLVYLYKSYDLIPRFLNGYYCGVMPPHDKGVDKGITPYNEDNERPPLLPLPYFGFYKNYITNNGVNKVSNIRNILNDKIDYSSLKTIMSVDNSKLDLWIVHKLNEMFNYSYQNDYKLLNVEFVKSINENYELINEVYKKWTKRPYNIELDKQGYKQIFKMVKSYYETIDLLCEEKNTDIYIQPKKTIYDYKLNHLLTLKNFENTNNHYVISNNNTQRITEQKLNDYMYKLENGKRITNIKELSTNIYNNLIMNEYYVNVNKDTTYSFIHSFKTFKSAQINQKIPTIKIYNSFYNPLLGNIKYKVDKNEFINVDKKKLKVYGNVITKWIDNEPINHKIYRIYKAKIPTIKTLHYDKEVYNLNNLEVEYKVYKSLIHNINHVEPFISNTLIVCN